MEYVDQQINLFDMYPGIDKFLDSQILSVNPNYRGAGIAGLLVERTAQFMRENKISVIRVFCTGIYSARVMEKMGLKKVYTLPYVDYVVNGENPILPAAPHTALQVYVQEI